MTETKFYIWATKEISKWWSRVRFDLDDIISQMYELDRAHYLTPDERYLKWYEKKKEIFKVLLEDFPVGGKYEPFCDAFPECEKCPYAMVKGRCTFSSSIVGKIRKQVEILLSLIELYPLEEMPWKNLY